MKTWRKHAGTGTLAVISLLLLAAIADTTGLSGTAGPSAALAASPGGTSPTSPAVDMFLQIQGIDGEATTATHKGWIEVQSWDWGVAQAAGAGAGGGATISRLTGHVSIVKPIDKATPLLFKHCNDGTVLPLATVELARGGGGPTYMHYELKNVIVSSLTHGDLNGDGIPDEEIKLDFNGIKLTYTQLDASGKPISQGSAEGTVVPAIP
jgi:type VI secretion system Hcp family effector